MVFSALRVSVITDFEKQNYHGHTQPDNVDLEHGVYFFYGHADELAGSVRRIARRLRRHPSSYDSVLEPGLFLVHHSETHGVRERQLAVRGPGVAHCTRLTAPLFQDHSLLFQNVLVARSLDHRQRENRQFEHWNLRHPAFLFFSPQPVDQLVGRHHFDLKTITSTTSSFVAPRKRRAVKCADTDHKTVELGTDFSDAFRSDCELSRSERFHFFVVDFP